SVQGPAGLLRTRVVDGRRRTTAARSHPSPAGDTHDDHGAHLAGYRSARAGLLLGAVSRAVDRLRAAQEERGALPVLVLLGGRRPHAARLRDLSTRPGLHPRPGRRSVRLRAQPILHPPHARTTGVWLRWGARHRFATPAEARLAVFDFIEGWYNPRRR